MTHSGSVWRKKTDKNVICGLWWRLVLSQSRDRESSRLNTASGTSRRGWKGMKRERERESRHRDVNGRDGCIAQVGITWVIEHSASQGLYLDWTKKQWHSEGKTYFCINTPPALQNIFFTVFRVMTFWINKCRHKHTDTRTHTSAGVTGQHPLQVPYRTDCPLLSPPTLVQHNFFPHPSLMVLILHAMKWNSNFCVPRGLTVISREEAAVHQLSVRYFALFQCLYRVKLLLIIEQES